MTDQTSTDYIADNSQQALFTVPHAVCPKHGAHQCAIHSTIPGHEGAWCQICWLESMGPPLPVEHLPVKVMP